VYSPPGSQDSLVYSSPGSRFGQWEVILPILRSIQQSLKFLVSDETADVVDVVYVNMYLDLWGALGWVKQQGKNS
jgi:hypothetical protein